MPKKLAVNGRTVWVEEADFDDVCEMFKENVTVDDLESWESKEDMQKYDASTLFERARHYYNQVPPDLIQSAEKTWFGAVYAVRKLYLSGGEGINPKSHETLKFCCRYALSLSLKHSELQDDVFWKLLDIWTSAEKMHSFCYGSKNVSSTEFLGIIGNVEFFADQFSKLDGNGIVDQFKRDFIINSNPKVIAKEKKETIQLGGFPFKYKYSVTVSSFVPK